MENKENEMIVEINGIKMIIDPRTAKVQSIDTFKVGDSVQLLMKGRYNDGKRIVKDGIITGFANFEAAPTIIVAYINDDYGDFSIGKAYINKDNEEVQIVAGQSQSLDFNAATIRRKFMNNIDKKENDLKEAKKELELFDIYFSLTIKDMEELKEKAAF